MLIIIVVLGIILAKEQGITYVMGLKKFSPIIKMLIILNLLQHVT